VLPWLEPDRQRQCFELTGPSSDDPSSKDRELWARYVAASQHLHHPLYMGHQVCPPLPVAALADLVAGLLNNSVAIYEMSPAATAIEASVVGWMIRTLGLGPKADGLLTSGGSLGNLRALLTARHVALGEKHMLGGRLAVVASDQVHYSVQRAAGALGLGTDAVVSVATDEAFQMQVEALEGALDGAADQGLEVFAVVANAGSTATGAYDPLLPIAELCEARGLWLHVDGAHGASAALSARHRHLLDGIDRVDSVVWDAHKLLLVPSLVTGVLFKDGRHSEVALSDDAPYLHEAAPDRACADLSHRTLECTKNAMALKLFALLEVHGPDVLTDAVEHLFGLASQLGALLDEAPDFELATVPQCNIVCFRYCPPSWKDVESREVDARNESIRRSIIESGELYLVRTPLRGRTFLRVALMNPLAETDHLVALLEKVRAAGLVLL